MRQLPGGPRQGANGAAHAVSGSVHIAGFPRRVIFRAMTYLAFHAVFIIPVILVLAFATWLRPSLGPRARWSLPVLAVLAFAWTTPWDNYLVARGVWQYGEDRVLGTLGWVPYEEYAFFLLQPFLTGFWFYLVLGWLRPDPTPDPRGAGRLPVVFWIGVAIAGALLLRVDATTYLGLILAWAAPVIAAQWAFAGSVIRRLMPAVLAGVAVPTLYLWIVDRIAIRRGIWHIAERYSTGIAPFGLPVEEAVFFLVTNLLVVYGLVLFLYPPRRST